jgi:hypothetical protein
VNTRAIFKISECYLTLLRKLNRSIILGFIDSLITSYKEKGRMLFSVKLVHCSYLEDKSFETVSEAGGGGGEGEIIFETDL